MSDEVPPCAENAPDRSGCDDLRQVRAEFEVEAVSMGRMARPDIRRYTAVFPEVRSLFAARQR